MKIVFDVLKTLAEGRNIKERIMASILKDVVSFPFDSTAFDELIKTFNL